MAINLNYAVVSHTGKVRSNNEDNFWCAGDFLPSENQGTDGVISASGTENDKLMFGVFDGMGGESCGEIAAYLSAQSCGKWYNDYKRFPEKGSKEFWLDLCNAMNKSVCDYAKDNKIYTMGCTAAMMVFDQKTAYACNLGDSRIYEWKDGNLKMLSEDHVFRRRIYGKPPLLQYVGIPEDHMVLEPTTCSMNLTEGSRYLICSDGVTDMLSEEEIASLMAEENDMKTIAERILDCSLENGGRDNITLILIEAKEEKRGWFSGLFGRKKGQER
ncbi:MAG: serine/threonine-protein phosphatase [Clostridiales bacterium]|nr:serine/threonine-protein phosphatase [Candidatus Blautia equi]